MSCPICEKRKASRFCPAKAEKICAVCCGTEREVYVSFDAGGRCEIPSVEPGAYSLSFRSDDGTDAPSVAAVPVEIPDVPEHALDVDLP